MSMSKKEDKILSEADVKKVLQFLFGEDSTSKYMDMRTEIQEKELFKTLTYYRLLEEDYECRAAGSVANILERLAVSAKRMGRIEGVTILRQQLPKEDIVIRGFSRELEAREGAPVETQ